MKHVATALLIAALSWGCGGENTSSKVAAPGSEETAKTKALEAGASLMQDNTPLAALNAYMNGFDF